MLRRWNALRCVCGCVRVVCLRLCLVFLCYVCVLCVLWFFSVFVCLCMCLYLCLCCVCVVFVFVSVVVLEFFLVYSPNPPGFWTAFWSTKNEVGLFSCCFTAV